MKQVFVSVLFLGVLVSACSGSQGSGDEAPGTGRLRIEVACSADSDCPATFECESETEHGTTTTFCQSHDDANPDGSGAQCPRGFELEVEHGTSFCKPHGGRDDRDHGEGGSDDGSGRDGSGHDGNDDGGAHDAGDDHGQGGDDGVGHDAGDDKGQGGDDSGHDVGDDKGHGGESGSDDSGHSGRR